MAFSLAQNCTRRRVVGGSPLRLTAAKRFSSTKIHNINNVESANVVTLSNNVRVATEPSASHLASINVLIAAGSSKEGANNNGVANLINNATLKSFSGKARQIGASFTGSVCREYTQYNITCMKDQVPAAVALLGEALQAPPSKDAVEAARAEIISGRRALWNVVNEEVVFDYLHSAAYQGTPLAHTAAGEIKVLKGLSEADLETFKSATYKGNDIVVAATGAIDAKFDSLAQAAFSSIPNSSSSFLSARRVDFTGSMMAIRDDTVHDVQVAIGYETFPITHPHAITLAVLKQLLGQWDFQSSAGNNASNRLAETISSEKLACRYHAFNHHYQGSGVFGIYASTTDVDRSDDLVYEIFNEYNKLSSYISPEDLFRAKNDLKAKVLAAGETASGRSQSISYAVHTLNRVVPTSELFRRIDQVTVADVSDLIGTYFYDVDPVVVAHGNLEEMPEYGILRGWTYWNRW